MSMVVCLDARVGLSMRDSSHDTRYLAANSSSTSRDETGAPAGVRTGTQTHCGLRGNCCLTLSREDGNRQAHVVAASPACLGWGRPHPGGFTQVQEGTKEKVKTPLDKLIQDAKAKWCVTDRGTGAQFLRQQEEGFGTLDERPGVCLTSQQIHCYGTYRTHTKVQCHKRD